MARYLKLKEIDSTNDYARQLLRIYTVEELNNTVICAHSQTRGRGVGTNRWYSEPGKNLTLSIIHSPNYLVLDQVFYLSKTVSCALIDFLGDYNIEAKIKWPNDILCSRKKCAGILIENTVSYVYRRVKASVIGIGLNVNQTLFPSGLKATSMKLLTKQEYELSDLLEQLIEKIFLWLSALSSGRLDQIDSFYFSHLYLFNKTSQFRVNDEVLEGKIRGVDQYGRLILEIPEQNSLKLFWQKEIEYLNL